MYVVVYCKAEPRQLNSSRLTDPIPEDILKRALKLLFEGPLSDAEDTTEVIMLVLCSCTYFTAHLTYHDTLKEEMMQKAEEDLHD